MVKPNSGVGGCDAEIANRNRLLGYDMVYSDIVPPVAQVADSYIQDGSAYFREVKQDIDQERLTECQERERWEMKGNEYTHATHGVTTSGYACLCAGGNPVIGLQACSTRPGKTAALRRRNDELELQRLSQRGSRLEYLFLSPWFHYHHYRTRGLAQPQPPSNSSASTKVQVRPFNNQLFSRGL